MSTTPDDLEHRLRETLHAIGAATQPPDRLVESLHRAATDTGRTDQTVESPAQVILTEDLRPGRRTRVHRWAPVLAVAAVLIVLAAGVGAVVVHRPPPPRPAGSVPTTTTPMVASQWTRLPAAPIKGRSDGVGAWTGTQMLVWGGATHGQQGQPGQVMSDGAAYDPSTKSWSRLPDAPIAGRSSPVSVWTGRSLFVWGGNTSTDAVAPAEDGALYTPADQSWVTLPPVPLPGYQEVVALRSGELVILLTTPRDGAHDVVHAQSYQPATNSWSRLPDLHLPSGHDILQVSAVAAGDQIHLWSMWNHATALSRSSTSNNYGIDSYTFDVPTHEWAANTLAGPAVKAVDRPLWTGREILLPAVAPFCGVCSIPHTYDLQGVMVDPANGATSTIPHGPVDGLDATYLWTGAALLAVNTRTLVQKMGPTNSTSSMVSSPGEAAVWDPQTQLWTRLPDAPAGGAESPVTVWTGTSLLIWGQFTHAIAGGSLSQETAGLQLG